MLGSGGGQLKWPADYFFLFRFLQGKGREYERQNREEEFLYVCMEVPKRRRGKLSVA